MNRAFSATKAEKRVPGRGNSIYKCTKRILCICETVNYFVCEVWLLKAHDRRLARRVGMAEIMKLFSKSRSGAWNLMMEIQ